MSVTSFGSVQSCALRWRSKRILPALGLCIGLFFVARGYAAPSDPARGEYQLRVEEGGRIWLRANEAPLREVVQDLETALAIRIRVAVEAGRTISGTYEGIELNRFLFSLDENFILFYVQDLDSGNLRVTRGGMSQPGSPARSELSTDPADGAPDGNESPSGNAAAQDELIRYTVMEGDTLADIAKLFIVSRDRIAATNGLAIDARLQEGQQLLIPQTDL